MEEKASVILYKGCLENKMKFYVLRLAFSCRFAYNKPKFGKKDDGYARLCLQKQGRTSY